MSYIVGRCKKRYSKVLPIFKGGPDIENEYSYEIGDIISIHLSDDSDFYSDRKEHRYYIYLNYNKFPLSREEVEDLVDIIYEEGCYNSCIKDGFPCCKLIGYTDGNINTSNSKKSVLASCLIGWEVGRGFCYRYEKECL